MNVYFRHPYGFANFGQAVANSQGPDWTAETTRLLFRGREMQGNDSTLEASAKDMRLLGEKKKRRK